MITAAISTRVAIFLKQKRTGQADQVTTGVIHLPVHRVPESSGAKKEYYSSLLFYLVDVELSDICSKFLNTVSIGSHNVKSVRVFRLY